MTLSGRRIVVVGASASIGRALAKQAIAAGAEVVVAARRLDRLEDLVKEAGGGTPVAVDVRDSDGCEVLMSKAAEVLGQIDAICYTVGYAPLKMLKDTTSADWSAVFETNVVGSSHVIRAGLRHLVANAVVMVLSSETVGRPRGALGAYGSSKAALDESLEAWRGEHPEVRFCRTSVGATWPTEFGDHFDSELLPWAMNDWVEKGLFQEAFMETDELAQVLLDVLATLVERPGVAVEQMLVRSPAKISGGAPNLPSK